jgi:hypothetical protein
LKITGDLIHVFYDCFIIIMQTNGVCILRFLELSISRGLVHH